jgi:hypothetical protein
MPRTAPRPFAQLARRAHRLGLPVPLGYTLGGMLCYPQHRRQPQLPGRQNIGYYALHRRRIRLDIHCRRAGMQMLRPGVWCDNVAEVMYAGYGACDWGQW